MRRYVFKMMYDGTEYHGFQVQNNAVTIQSTIQDKLEIILGERPPVKGCSRTDSGVHAFEYYFTADFEKNISTEKLVKALNFHLPKDIRILSAAETNDDFHPRYSALWKEYKYFVWLSKVSNPFIERFSYFYPYNTDIERIIEYAPQIEGKRDFAAFMASGSSITDTVRNVMLCKAEYSDNLLTFTVRADGFLYNMVRIIVGTLLDGAAGKLKGNIDDIIESRDRSRAGQTVPAKGLFLNKVYYGKELNL